MRFFNSLCIILLSLISLNFPRLVLLFHLFAVRPSHNSHIIFLNGKQSMMNKRQRACCISGKNMPIIPRRYCGIWDFEIVCKTSDGGSGGAVQRRVKGVSVAGTYGRLGFHRLSAVCKLYYVALLVYTYYMYDTLVCNIN